MRMRRFSALVGASLALAIGHMAFAYETEFKGPMPKGESIPLTMTLDVRIPRSASDYERQDLVGLLITPSPKGKRGTVLVATPYRRELAIQLYGSIAEADLNVLIVDVAGSGSSDGAWQSMNITEQRDVQFIIDSWIPSQSWSNGRVGMAGASYMGIIQLLAAGLVERNAQNTPTHLRGIMPEFVFADSFSDIVMQGGTLNLGFIPAWLGAVDVFSLLPPIRDIRTDGTLDWREWTRLWKAWQQHAQQVPVSLGWILDPGNLIFNPFYQERSPMIYWPGRPRGDWDLPGMDAYRLPSHLPSFFVGGWRDIFLRGTLNNFAWGKNGNAERKLIIGDWYHFGGTSMPDLPDLGNRELARRWFKALLNDDTRSPILSKFPVLTYVTGAKRWRAERDWPLPPGRTVKKRWFPQVKYASTIPGDWFSEKNKEFNFLLSSTAETAPTGLWPVSIHHPSRLRGWNSRSLIRWTAGLFDLPWNLADHLRPSGRRWDRPWDDERTDDMGCLTFTTEPFSQALGTAGSMIFRFAASTTFLPEVSQDTESEVLRKVAAFVRDTGTTIETLMHRQDVQWVVEIEDIDPMGRAVNVTGGWLASWHRPYRSPERPQDVDPRWSPDNPFQHRSHRIPLPIKSGITYHYAMELWPSAHQFEVGHRLRVTLSHSDFPHLLPYLIPSANQLVFDPLHPPSLEANVITEVGKGSQWRWVDDPKSWLYH